MDSFRKMMSTPKALARDLIAPTGKDSSPVGHSNLFFDEVSQEWQAAIVESPYEVQNSQALDSVVQNNFGTVDNPHVIFTGDVPFRFVGCSGAPNEDDYDGHEFLLFLLREGPLQRCPSCGQVYKLVRLRDEASETNDYYSSSLFGQDIQELGEADHFLQQNPIRAVLTFNYEHTIFEIRSDFLYSLANPDDHDRFLVDPAYRLERVKLMEEKNAVYNRVINEIESAFNESHGAPKFNINKVNYENLVTAEVALEELDNHFKKVHKFKLRNMYDQANHARREARMIERAKSRLGDNMTLYFDRFTDDDIKYEDYFETDHELELAKELNSNAKTKALRDPSMNFDNIKFQEQWTVTYNEDHQPIIQQKIFKFKYREALGTYEDHIRRESRMLSRLSDNMGRLEEKYNDYITAEENRSELESSSKIDVLSKEKEFYDELIRFNIQNYKNYFESDNETDFDIISELPNEARLEVIDGLYLEEFNQILDKVQLKALTVGSVPGDEDGFINTIRKVYSTIKDELPGIQTHIDSYNIDEKNAEIISRGVKNIKAHIEGSKAQITDKSDK